MSSQQERDDSVVHQTLGSALRVDDLCVRFPGNKDNVVDHVSFSIGPGRVLGVVGESGSGKSSIGFSIAGLLDTTGAEVSGRVTLRGGANLLEQSERDWTKVRGRRIGYVFQEPMTSLNPLLTVRRQLTEPLVRQLGMTRPEAAARALELCNEVEIPDARRRLGQYPHELSGGMRQRVVLALALSCSPELLIADEPTTALDVTVQAQVIDLLRRLNDELGMTVLFVSHDLNVVAQIADEVMVMRNGKVAESGPAQRILQDPQALYTQKLVTDIPTFQYATAKESKFWGSL
jgi:ABC-type glutathione transport system ATPase component